MEDNCRIVLRLEVLRSDQGPMSGLVVEPDGRAHDFSGWSELFAVLQVLVGRS